MTKQPSAMIFRSERTSLRRCGVGIVVLGANIAGLRDQMPLMAVGLSRLLLQQAVQFSLSQSSGDEAADSLTPPPSTAPISKRWRASRNRPEHSYAPRSVQQLPLSRRRRRVLGTVCTTKPKPGPSVSKGNSLVIAYVTTMSFLKLARLKGTSMTLQCLIHEVFSRVLPL